MSIDAITQVLGLAGTAVGTTEKAADLINKLKQLLQNGDEEENAPKIAMLNDLATQLTAANVVNVDISTRLKSLSNELEKEDKFEAERARYELVMTAMDVPVYRLRADAAGTQPEHYVCPVCLHRDKLISYISGRGDFKVCQTERSHQFRFKDTPVSIPSRKSRY